VSARLADELGDSVREVSWTSWDRSMSAGDWFFTAELFSEEERPGFSAFLAARSGRAAAVFHDAIPLKWPQITWPQSVARHPSYMKMLAQFDRVWAVSAASCAELAGFWRWQGLEQVPPLDVLALGADADRAPRVTGRVGGAVEVIDLGGDFGAEKKSGPSAGCGGDALARRFGF
jgi:hypothetical protein